MEGGREEGVMQVRVVEGWAFSTILDRHRSPPREGGREGGREGLPGPISNHL